MVKDPRREINKKIENCRQLLRPEKIINCLEKLLRDTNNAWVAYELGREYEKTGQKTKAFICFDMAEDLFEDPNLKNMAQAALNNLVVEEIIEGKKKKKKSANSF